MRYLLTSSGISNASIRAALVDLLAKPIAESDALCVATGMYPFPGGPQHAYRFITGDAGGVTNLGWKSLGVLELTALPSIDPEVWKADVRNADALLLWGGHALYLCHWLRESGFADLLPSLRDEVVYVGTSASSMAAGPEFGETDYLRNPPVVDEQALGLVEFSVAPHLDHPDFPGNSLAELEKWAAAIPNPAYAIDDQSAVKVIDGKAEVVSEGSWKLFNG